jgi:hypothetical protein
MHNLYFKDRGEIFTLAARIGVPIAAMWFVYRPTETWNYFDIVYFHRLVLVICILTSFLPLFLIYILVYCVNGFLIRKWGSDELKAMQEQIIRSLILAQVADGLVERKERDLLEEHAWASLRSLWRSA